MKNCPFVAAGVVVAAPTEDEPPAFAADEVAAARAAAPARGYLQPLSRKQSKTAYLVEAACHRLGRRRLPLEVARMAVAAVVSAPADNPPVTTGSQEDDVAAVLDVVAGAQAGDEGLVQVASGPVVYIPIFQCCRWLCPDVSGFCAG